MKSEKYMPYSDGRRQAGQALGPVLLNSHRSMRIAASTAELELEALLPQDHSSTSIETSYA
jgi:hypothetical protein